MQKSISPTKAFAADVLKNSKGKNMALKLYETNTRVAFFMLQAIARLNSKAFNDKAAEKHLAYFKKMEDALGAIDYYDVLHKQVTANKLMPPEVLAYFEKKRNKAIEKLNKFFSKTNLPDTLKQATEDLSFINDPIALQQLKRAYKEEVNDVIAFYEENKEGITDMEEHVHEFRRKLRWLSIYAQAYAGLFVLKSASKKQTWEKLYLSKEIVNSAFNKLPENKNYNGKILLDKVRFFALSSIIKQLGDIKDEGLTHEALAKALRKTTDIDKKAAKQKASELLNTKFTHDALLKKSHTLLKNALEKQSILKDLLLT
jgi:hypothetical protein